MSNRHFEEYKTATILMGNMSMGGQAHTDPVYAAGLSEIEFVVISGPLVSRSIECTLYGYTEEDAALGVDGEKIAFAKFEGDSADTGDKAFKFNLQCLPKYKKYDMWILNGDGSSNYIAVCAIMRAAHSNATDETVVVI